MDQDPLPRASSQVADRLAQVVDLGLELAKATIAVVAENATYVTEQVIAVPRCRAGAPQIAQTRPARAGARRTGRGAHVERPPAITPLAVRAPCATAELLSGFHSPESR